MGRVFAIYSRQERAGRTVTATNLAVLFARAGRRTILVDLGPSWRGARALGLVIQGLSEPSSEPLLPVRGRPGLLIAPRPYPPDPARAAILATEMREWSDGEQEVVLNLPGFSEGVQEAILGGVDRIVLVVRPGADALPALAEGLQGLAGAKGASNPALRVEGVLVTMGDRRLLHFERMLTQTERAFPVEVFPFCVPWDEAVAATETGPATVVEAAPTCRGARGYVELATELMSHG